MADPQKKTLRDVLPDAASCYGTPAFALLDVEVITVHGNGGGWPGKQKYICCWWVLSNGNAVGWNENPSHGWSFPVVKYKNPAAAALGKLGGTARAQNLSADERSAIAKKAADARWGK